MPLLLRNFRIAGLAGKKGSASNLGATARFGVESAYSFTLRHTSATVPMIRVSGAGVKGE
ncbi:hypothetical protein GHYDROH2_16570 [Geobacter hydrogenophilus]|uniref:Uncharacterized protein n=1 Tax=Geobacter hydrogenophilus TaxID=40983 RepID=A0A9W6G0C3_9BACT|nr:hypothetical protein GHYDROH2_16570 [Geobacter hydrogenophilus]